MTNDTTEQYLADLARGPSPGGGPREPWEGEMLRRAQLLGLEDPPFAELVKSRARDALGSAALEKDRARSERLVHRIDATVGVLEGLAGICGLVVVGVCFYLLSKWD
jgi:hypothetical protein